MLMAERWNVRQSMGEAVPSYMHAATDAVLFGGVCLVSLEIRIAVKNKLQADMPVVYCVGSMQIYGYHNDNIGGAI